MRQSLKRIYYREFSSQTTIRVIKASRKRKEITSNNEFKSNAADTNVHNSTNEPKRYTKTTSEYRENEMHIQMLSKSIYEQIFKNQTEINRNSEHIAKYIESLKAFGLKPGSNSILPDVNIHLPRLHGSNLEEHFYEIGHEQSKEYRCLIDRLLQASIPAKPERWSEKPGWTKYDANGRMESVPYPEDRILVFDVEVCMSEGSAPTIASAVSHSHWYSWTSESLFMPQTGDKKPHPDYYTDDKFIPMEPEKICNAPKLVIGHNVSYDRARIKNQYQLKCSGMRFLDTMALHVCVSGVTSYQRAMLKSKAPLKEDDLVWQAKTSLNSLKEVYKLYCSKNQKDNEIDKGARDLFVSGPLADVRDNFQMLMTYCANDVQATFHVFEHLYPMFCERFPHPVTFAGMLELGMAYLPVNSNWHRYINESNLIYEDLNIESNYLLAKQANQACRLLHNQAHENDLWMWDQDWSSQQMKLKLTKKKSVTKSDSHQVPCDRKESTASSEYNILEQKFMHLFEKSVELPKITPFLAGYPAWYRDLCSKRNVDGWRPGPMSIGTGMKVCPKLLSLTWEGYPLHHIREHGWGFLVPFKNSNDNMTDAKVPLKALQQKCPIKYSNSTNVSNDPLVHNYDQFKTNIEDKLSLKQYPIKNKSDPKIRQYTKTGIWCDIEIDNSCWFFRLPHKDGDSLNVGNPLSRNFLIKITENVLAGDNAAAERIIKIARMLSYWRNNRDRIMNQLVVVCGSKYMPSPKQPAASIANGVTAAILPQVVTCGTLTRRAMEPTWMTASNAQIERVGSELRTMIQAPKGYRIVGADVDSQELWIASLLGDAGEAKIHGVTPLGWMTLNGTKTDATDMHSVTAKAVGISRDHAKILNYARIYGAGHQFASRLLKQYNPTISENEAKSKAIKIFAMTKGKKLFYPRDALLYDLEYRGYSKYEAQQMAARHRKPINELFNNSRWSGGTESAMFNQLEQIATKEQPRTPFLNCQLSRALSPESGVDDRFLPTRVNWVVQSGAVDFLHLMLVCMRWLMSNKIRFCLSFHDDVRYITEDEHAYQTALAMHITNLLTRAFFSSRLGMMDLPQSIAFFASVEVDTILRKEANSDCITPSNPHGLLNGYDIPRGETLDIYQAIEKVNCSDLKQWPWHKDKKNKD